VSVKPSLHWYAAWRDLLSKIDEELVVWGRTFKRTVGIEPSFSDRLDDASDERDLDPFDQSDDDGNGRNAWDRLEESEAHHTA
jgi:hypothetical protein